MKESKEITPISLLEIIEDGMYFDSNNQLIKVLKIDIENKEMDVFNLTEQIKYYNIKIDKHKLIKRIR